MYNGAIDHPVSSLKPCVSSHSSNKGKMSSVYRPEKMDHLIFCHWLWDMFMKSSTSTHRPLCQYAQPLRLLSFCLYRYLVVLFHLSACLRRFYCRRRDGAVTANCNRATLLLGPNYSCDSAWRKKWCNSHRVITPIHIMIANWFVQQCVDMYMLVCVCFTFKGRIAFRFLSLEPMDWSFFEVRTTWLVLTNFSLDFRVKTQS